jgi:hypothetical protein
MSSFLGEAGVIFDMLYSLQLLKSGGVNPSKPPPVGIFSAGTRI